MVSINVRLSAGSPIIEVIKRTPVQHKRWQSVTYKGKRYQLFGGPYTDADYRINLSLPIG